MFVLKNELGTAFIKTESKLRCDDLIRRGWTLEKDEKEKPIEKMKKEELEKFAEENGIDISDAKK